MFFTYEHVHCVRTPEILEGAWYNIVCLNLDYCPSVCEAAVIVVLLQYIRITSSWGPSGSFLEIPLGLLSCFPRPFCRK